MNYAIPAAVLAKWAAERLVRVPAPSPEQVFVFHLEGSTCSDGGTPFGLALRMALGDSPRGPVVTDARVELDPREHAAHRALCGWRQGGEQFLRQLQQPAFFCGQTLDEALAQLVVTNPAGCLCTPPMVHHKWQLALSTLHYALQHGSV